MTEYDTNCQTPRCAFSQMLFCFVANLRSRWIKMVSQKSLHQVAVGRATADQPASSSAPAKPAMNESKKLASQVVSKQFKTLLLFKCTIPFHKVPSPCTYLIFMLKEVLENLVFISKKDKLKSGLISIVTPPTHRRPIPKGHAQCFPCGFFTNTSPNVQESCWGCWNDGGVAKHGMTIIVSQVQLPWLAGSQALLDRWRGQVWYNNVTT